MPSVILFLSWLGTDRLDITTGVFFGVLIPAWYVARSIAEWFYGYVALRGMMAFLTLASDIVPGFAELLDVATEELQDPSKLQQAWENEEYRENLKRKLEWKYGISTDD